MIGTKILEIILLLLVATSQAGVYDFTKTLNSNTEISTEKNISTTIQKDLYEKNPEKLRIIYQPDQIDNTQLSIEESKTIAGKIPPSSSLLGFTSSSIENGATGVSLTQFFNVSFDFEPTNDFIQTLSFSPEIDFTYTLNGQNLTIFPEKMDRLTTYTFGGERQSICLGIEPPSCFGGQKFALTFTTTHYEYVIYGHSVEGRDLVGYIFGRSDDNGKIFFLNGGIHGHEWRAGDLTGLINYLKKYPQELEKQNKTFVIVPFANPDGTYYNTKENANTVNLDRDWDIHWESRWNSGPHPFSQPETVALRDLIIQYDPDYLITYHAQWPPDGIIFMGGDGSVGTKTYNFAKWVSDKTGYPIGYWDGGLAAEEAEWTAARGITSILIESTYIPNSDWSKNFPMYLALIRDF